MRAIKEGNYRLTDTLARFYPYIPGAAKITIQQMLQMASDSNFQKIRKGWKTCNRSSTGMPPMLSYPEPKEHSNIVPSTTIYWQVFLTKVSGKSYDALLTDFYQ